MSRLLAAPWCFVVALSLPAQSIAPPSQQEAIQIFGELADLMESTAVVIPELARAGAPLQENVRQAIVTLETGPSREDAGVVYRLLSNARAYLELSDMLPKPPTFSGALRKQLDDLRRNADLADLYFRDLLDRREETARGADRDNLARYAEENARLGPPQPNDPRVVFLGDSITDAWELNQFFRGGSYVNRGIGGPITGQMLGRLKADVLDLQPAAMVLLGGTNDLARSVPLSTIENNIAMIADLAAAQGVKPIVASVLPVSDYHAEGNPLYRRTSLRSPQRIEELNRWLRGFAEQRGYRYLDYYSALVDAQGRLPAELADDGLHPNLEGYKRMAPLAQQAVEEALRGSPNQRRKRGSR